MADTVPAGALLPPCLCACILAGPNSAASTCSSLGPSRSLTTAVKGRMWNSPAQADGGGFSQPCFPSNLASSCEPLACLSLYLLVCLLSAHLVSGLLVDLNSKFVIHRYFDCPLWTHWFTLTFKLWVTLDICDHWHDFLAVICLDLQPQCSSWFSTSVDKS